jgi:hypothetical protein
MRKMKKLILTTAALAALAVGGAAFAQAQNAAAPAKLVVQHAQGETGAPGDTDNVQSGDQTGSDQGGQAGDQSESGEAGGAHETETSD